MRDPIAAALTRLLGVRVHDAPRRVSGGSIHDAFAYSTDEARLFVKVCPRASAPMLAAEASGLRALASTNTIRVPRVLAFETLEDRALLCLEWIELVAPKPITHKRLGEQLAALHACIGERHGWPSDNFIGATPQLNAQRTDWRAFFRTQRLEPQLALAARRGADRRTLERGARLCESLGAWLSDHRPQPSLLHGDLWGGNWGANPQGDPIVFDPAVYYGDRETDLAMTHLFGGFGREFYAAYEAAWPLDAGARARQPLYNLYHVLNHFNLFGGGYLAQARAMIDRLLAEAGVG